MADDSKHSRAYKVTVYVISAVLAVFVISAVVVLFVELFRDDDVKYDFYVDYYGKVILEVL